MLKQHRLRFAGIYIEAAGDDHVLAAIKQREEAANVEAAEVAGAT